MPEPDRSWLQVMKPITDRLDLCAKMDLQFVEGAKGCAAMSKLVKEMARIIDQEIDRRDGG